THLREATPCRHWALAPASPSCFRRSTHASKGSVDVRSPHSGLLHTRRCKSVRLGPEHNLRVDFCRKARRWLIASGEIHHPDHHPQRRVISPAKNDADMKCTINRYACGACCSQSWHTLYWLYRRRLHGPTPRGTADCGIHFGM